MSSEDERTLRAKITEANQSYREAVARLNHAQRHNSEDAPYWDKQRSRRYDTLVNLMRQQNIPRGKF